MKARSFRTAAAAIIVFITTFFFACGGGSGSSGTQPPPPAPPPPALTITTASPLPGTLQDQQYSVTLQAENGVGALTWSIAPLSSTALFVNGLSIDPGTGVLSGTANWSGTAGFVATVKDSAAPSRTATKGFTVGASTPLQAPPPQTIQVGQFQNVFAISVGALNGVWPLTFTLTGGSLPFGLKLNSQSGLISGSATILGTYPCIVTIQDSYTPPEVVTAQVTLQVIPPPLMIANSLPQQLLLNRPFSGRVVATGGVPPYRFSVTSGSLPPGLGSLDINTGQVRGTPTTLGQYFIGVNVIDSSTPTLLASGSFSIAVTNPLGRNDTLATATPIDNVQILASISPYIDPPDSAPLPGDTDYYKLVSLSGTTVHVETQAQRWWPGDPLDTVIEILDASGNQPSTCRQPGDTSTNFASACINDDIPSPPTTDSALDFKVPGPANTPTTFYVHVLDWRGNARPDMRYALLLSGLAAPLSISSAPLLPAARGLPYSQQLVSANGIGTVSWSIASGNFAPGLTLSSSGALTGTGTSDGTYSFSIQATDSGAPPQIATAQKQIQVVEPVQITSPATWPNACVNLPYSFAVQTSGGLPPFYWSFFSSNWVGINLDQSTGVFSGTASVTGTFTGSIGVNDATWNQSSQQVNLTVIQCP